MQPQSQRPNNQPIRARVYTNTTTLTPRSITRQAPSPVAMNPKARTKSGLNVSPRLASLIVVVVGLGIVTGLGSWGSASKPILPATVASQLSFGAYFPTTKTTIATIDKHAINYQAASGLLSYTAKLADGTTVNVNQQATPESFVDIPQAYDKLVSSLQPYTSFESINGRVSLTHPKELQGSQSAVMNAKGTLLFARPSKSLSNEQWRQLFNGLFTQQITATK